MMKKIVIIAMVMFISGISYAQDFYDALLFSQNNNLGTARSVSMGNAFGALGGDFSSASINPAGIGVYRSGEFTITPSYTFANSEANYLGINTNRNANLFNFSNIGYVTTNESVNTSRGFVSFTFGVGYNRLKDFKSKQRIVGYNAETSLLDYYTDWANGYNSVDNFDPHYEGLAYNTFLINDDPDPSVVEGIFYNDLATYYSTDENGDGSVIRYYQDGVLPHQQVKTINTSGSLNEFVLSFAGNIQHTTYIGATIGIQSLDYWQSTVFSEYDNQDLSSYLNHYDQYEDVNVSGEGVNIKLGVIHRFSRNLRIGAAFHSPTIFGLTYQSDKSIYSYFDQAVGDSNLGYNTQWDAESYNTYRYRLITPYKAMVSAAYQYSNRVTLSVDYELIKYGTARFAEARDDYFDYTFKNNENKQYLNSTNNLRGGVEIRVTPTFSLRGGYQYFGNSWKGGVENMSDVMSVASCGFGYRNHDYFVDFSLSRMYTEEQYAVHQIENNFTSNGTSNIAQINQNRLRAAVTIGLKF